MAGKIVARRAAAEDPQGRAVAHRKLSERQAFESAVPEQRRARRMAKSCTVRGARHNNFKNIDVDIPLEQFVCVTGASGRARVRLIHAIVQKQLYSCCTTVESWPAITIELTGHEHVSDVIDIDQSPIGRSSRSNPATYIGILRRHSQAVCRDRGSQAARIYRFDIQLQCQRRTLRGVFRRRHDHDAALVHARRGSRLPDLQRCTLQPGNAGSQVPRQEHRRRSRNVDRRGRRVLSRISRRSPARSAC